MIKLHRFVIFLLIFQVVFFIIYRNSDRQGFKKLRQSFRNAIVVAVVLASFSYTNTKVSVSSVRDNSAVREKLLSKRQFNLLEKNDLDVILVKGYEGPSIPPKTGRPLRPSPFPTQPLLPPTGPSRGTGLNPF